MSSLHHTIADLKCFRAVMAAMVAVSVMFPRWSRTCTSTRTDHTYSTTHTHTHIIHKRTHTTHTHLLSGNDTKRLSVHCSRLPQTSLEHSSNLCCQGRRPSDLKCRGGHGREFDIEEQFSFCRPLWAWPYHLTRHIYQNPVTHRETNTKQTDISSLVQHVEQMVE